MKTLEEAVAARKVAEASGDTTAWVRARALEEYIGRVTTFDPKVHPRGREGQFISAIGGLKPGEGIHLPSGVHVHRTGKLTYEVHGGVSHAGGSKPRKVRSKKWAAREALERHGVVTDAEHIAKLKPGEDHKVGHMVVERGDDQRLRVRPKAFKDVPELTTEHDSAIDAARNARRRASLGDDPEITPPDRRTAARQVTAPPLARITPKTYTTVERTDKVLPSDARGDVHVATVEAVPIVGDKIEKGEQFLFGKPAEKGAEHLGGHADPGVHAVTSHMDAAQHGGSIVSHVQDHAHEVLSKAAPHVGTGKHREALRSANHVVQHLAAAHGGDLAHTISHFASHLFAARYDAAKAARVEAERTGDTTEWCRARALEEYWAARLVVDDDRSDTRGSGRGRGHDLRGTHLPGSGLDGLEGLREARAALAPTFNPADHPRGRKGQFIDSLHKLQPGEVLSRNGFKIEWLPPVHSNPAAIGDINPGAMGSPGIFRLTKPDGQITTRRKPEQVADLVGGPGAGKGNTAGTPVPDMQQIIADKIAELHRNRTGKQGLPKSPSHKPFTGDSGALERAGKELADGGRSTSRILDDVIHASDREPPQRYKDEILRRTGDADVGKSKRGERHFNGLLDRAVRHGTGLKGEVAAKQQIKKYQENLRKQYQSLSDDELLKAFKGFGGTPGFFSHQIDALHAEFERRGIDPRPKYQKWSRPSVWDPADAPDPTTPVTIGATPYQGKPLSPEADVSDYFKSPRYRQFQSRVRADARERGLRVSNFSEVEGLWEGNKEPAVAVTVCCDTGRAEDMARDLGQHYNQDAVMTFTPDPGGDAFQYHSTEKVDTERALAAMGTHGLPGGRIKDGKLEIIDADGSAADTVFKLADDLGVDFHYDVGRASLLQKGIDYGRLGEAEGAPEDEADAGEGSSQGHHDHAAGQGARAVLEAYVASR